MNWSQGKSKVAAFCVLFLAATLAHSETKGQRRKGKTAQAKPSFTGAWSNFACLDREQVQCGGFILYLAQNGDRLCGEHFASSMGYGQINEGTLSISGSVHGNTGTVRIRSGRSETVFKARTRLARGGLDWTLLEAVVDDQDDGVIPDRVHLTRSRDREVNDHLSQIIQQCEGSSHE